MRDVQLPEGFQALEPFAQAWALPNEGERRWRRVNASMAELSAFYGAMIDRLDAAIDHLDRFDLGDPPLPEQRLMDMILSMAEVSAAVEVLRCPGIPDGIDPARFVEMPNL